MPAFPERWPEADVLLVADRKKVRFGLQPTLSFPDGSPQREECSSDGAFLMACRRYAAEWRGEYECEGCDDPLCPSCPHGRKGSRT